MRQVATFATDMPPAGHERAETGGPQRLSDIAYERILENLFARRLPAGAFVSQNQLVDLLEVPVAPLRDALRVLEAEGVVKIHPRSGIEFVKPGLELTRSTYQFRSIIERAAARVFAETAPDAQIKVLADDHANLIATIEDTGLQADALAEIERLEAALHEAIIGALGNPLIDMAARRMQHYLRLVRLERSLTAPMALRSLREHVVVLTACAARDVNAAEAAIVAHFTAALQRHMGLF